MDWPRFEGVPARVIREDAKLKARGFDGLYFPGECACLAEDLYPCGRRNPECRPGVRVPCECGEHDFHIVGDVAGLPGERFGTGGPLTWTGTPS